ncbi:LacI family DNA-binding transcriptional regulator [Planosporangium mesophilum]|uniref:LacI family transcriptional regulator n=1 Tax=Planosporangium mesophilum TaxID=689768 RepID=A0A8J3TB95_9ACTN|nr:LacI family DNA-binding transcriptional regulator [Planosporangium mesophilum]NJC84405.1 LacI family transcriptional regulator [Planosporangium mesophilum]GII23453.1 LacI family transcriptional regulator [Planosporangium mesophilum]
MQARTHVTLEDVARAAEVSLATASRALNGTAPVRQHLRERVLRAAEELAYTPNAHARALAGATHRTVGVICHDVSDPYFAAVAGGIMRVAGDNGMLVMLASTFREPEREIAYVSMLRAERAAAILLIGSGFEDPDWERALDAELDPYLAGGGRVAVVSRHRSLKVDSVLPENRAGAAAMARSLLDLGHRRFAVLTGSQALTTVSDRFGGFRDELKKAGVRLRPADVVEAPFTRDGGYAAMSELLARGLDATCVFAVTDVMAIGALSALREHGLSVPDDVSVAGFDDIPIVRDLTPPLTTVALPLPQLGERAMELALTENPGRRRRIHRMAGEVVIRSSTRKVSP